MGVTVAERGKRTGTKARLPFFLKKMQTVVNVATSQDRPI